ncbi:MAG: hypothetical protein QXZ13_02085 [Candidatus Diapherotrites archaeon]
MYFDFVYELGRKFPLMPYIKSWDQKFELVEFPYTSKEVASGSVIYFFVFAFLALLTFFVPLVPFIFGFVSIVIPLGAIVWATSIEYTQRIMSFREEMLQALLELSNYISLNTSMEAALKNVSENLGGVLGKQFRDITEKLSSKEYSTLGEAFEHYIPIWLKVNPEFDKGLNMLQKATQALDEERDTIINEVIETVILSYYDSGKRSTEMLSNQTKTLISIGVMIPMMSLIMLPLITIFLPQLANVALLVFVYVIFFPAMLLLMAMNFASNRVQVNTIDIKNSPKFREIPKGWYFAALGIVFLFFIWPILHISSIDLTTQEGIAREYTLVSIFAVWSGLFGLFVAIEFLTYVYAKRNEKVWLEMEETERDIPHLLQVFASYLSLNRSMESILDDVVNDYKRHGFGQHSTVKIISTMNEVLVNTKNSLKEIVEKILPSIAPSRRMSQILRRIVTFTEIEQKSAAKSAKMIRSQTLSIYKLDDYIQTLLAETISIVSLSTSVLAPLLATTATVMAAAIVMSLEFIKKKINEVLLAVGSTSIELELVKIDKIIPPTILELIVGLYFIETVVILSVFLSNIRNGTDRYKIAKTINENLLIGFIIYSLLLFGGYFAFTEIIFKGVLSGT